MSMRMRKVLGDLRQYRLSLALIAAVLVLGIAGVVAALNAQAILKREIASSFATADAPHAALWFDRVTQANVDAVAKMPGVVAAEPRRVVHTRIATKESGWLLLRLTVIQDVAAQKLGRVHVHGAWPPGDAGLFIEQSGAPLLDLGGPLQVRTPKGDIVAMPLAGLVHDTAVAPSTQERMIFGYATPAVAARLGQSADFDQLQIRLEQRGAAAMQELAAALTAQGMAPLRSETLAAEHPHALLMTAMLRVLGVLAAMAFACSAALAGYLVAAWMRREVRQVGILKSLGARWHQVAMQYFALVGPLIVAVVAVAMPLGIFLGNAVVNYYAVALNIDLADRGVPAALWQLEVAVAFLIPLFATLLPIVRAARMSPMAAIHDPGIKPLPVAGRLAARLMHVPGRARWSFALRNAWRRPWRLMTMLAGLSAGGALLLLTHSNYQSLMAVVDRSLAQQGHDIEVALPRRAPSAEIVAIAKRVPEVTVAEAWRRATVGVGTQRVGLSGMPADTQLFRLPLASGRMPAAANELLATRSLVDSRPQFAAGNTMELEFRGRVTTVRIAGVVEEIGTPSLYANAAVFDAITALGDEASSVRLKVNGELEAATAALDQAFLAARLPPSQIISKHTVKDSLDEHFKVVGDVIQMVALAAALVGGIILAATSGLNVLERFREIGILRTLGATPRRIGALFLAEGAAVALTAFAVAVMLSIPLTLAMLNAAEHRLLHVAVPLQFSWWGLAKLGMGVVIALVAVHLAVRYAMRKSVRETLAYE